MTDPVPSKEQLLASAARIIREEALANPIFRHPQNKDEWIDPGGIHAWLKQYDALAATNEGSSQPPRVPASADAKSLLEIATAIEGGGWKNLAAILRDVAVRVAGTTAPPGDDPMRPTMFGGAPAAVVEAVADSLVRKVDAEIMAPPPKVTLPGVGEAVEVPVEVSETFGPLPDPPVPNEATVASALRPPQKYWLKISINDEAWMDTEPPTSESEDQTAYYRASGIDNRLAALGRASKSFPLLRAALTKIRTAGYNWDTTAQWMQKVAANALEPGQWPDPGEQPATAQPQPVDSVSIAGLRRLAEIARSEYSWMADHEQADYREQWATLSAAIDWIDGLSVGGT